MRTRQLHHDFLPQILPQTMNGKLTYKIIIKKEYTRLDGTNALYLNIYYNRDSKKIPLNISVPTKYFDTKKQRVYKSYKYATEYNLLIEKVLADLNKIEINYRLNNETITIAKVIEDLYKPSQRLNFNVFASTYLEKTKNILKDSTYRQQKGALNKIKKFQDPLLFNEINQDFLIRFRGYLKKTLKNKPATIESTFKNFKKYLHAANDYGIKTDVHFSDIKVRSMKGNYTFLMPSELKNLLKFYNSPFIDATWKNILQRYLFSCFTGLRISDIEKLSNDNFIGNTLVFTDVKTQKLNRMPLNKTALSLVNLPNVFYGDYTREYINRELKKIAKAASIKKRLYYHSSRHTFATNYIISGGDIRKLQKLLGHSDLKTTVIYAHIVDELLNEEILLMDNLVKDDEKEKAPQN